MLNIDEYQSIHESKSHFDTAIPYNTYPCTIPLDFQSVPLHWHDDAEFIYIKKGCGSITLDSTEQLVQAGDIVLVLPGTVHGIFQVPGSSMEYENILFNTKILDTPLDETYENFLEPLFAGLIDLPTVFRQGVTGFESVRRYLDANDSISSNRTGAWGMAIKANLMMLFFNLVSLYESRLDTGRRSRIDKLKPVLKHVELHYTEPLSIADMATLAGFSESHFMRFFKEAFGVSFVTYLNDYRLAMAARLLLQSEENILTISQQVGFENLSHFNRCFKRKYLKTPREYRNYDQKTD